METLLVGAGWLCLLAGFVLFVPLMILGAKGGHYVGSAIGTWLGNACRNLLG